jgi:hypothetical protein
MRWRTISSLVSSRTRGKNRRYLSHDLWWDSPRRADAAMIARHRQTFLTVYLLHVLCFPNHCIFGFILRDCSAHLKISHESRMKWTSPTMVYVCVIETVLVVRLNIPVTGHNRLAQNRLSKCFIGATGCSFHPISSASKDAGESIVARNSYIQENFLSYSQCFLQIYDKFSHDFILIFSGLYLGYKFIQNISRRNFELTGLLN